MPKRILLIQANAASAEMIRRALDDAHETGFAIEWVRRCADGLDRLSRARPRIDAVLADLSLPDSRGVKTFDKLFRAAPEVPILILAGRGQEDAAKLAVQRGAQDYLLVGHLDGYWLAKTLHLVTERSANAEALFLEREHAHAMLDSIADAVIGTDASGNVTYMNPVAETMTGWSRGDAEGRALPEVFQVLDSSTREPVPDRMRIAMRGSKGKSLRENYVLIGRDGQETVIQDSIVPVRDPRGRVSGAVVVFRDASGARAMSLRVAHLAQHDYLTDLPNRMLLKDRLTQAIALARRHRQRMAVLFVDVDRFKHINDSLGHAIGDKLLQSVAQRLQGCVRKTDTVSRLGGDEFVVLLSEIAQLYDPALIADKILIALNAPHCIDEHDLHVTASMGIAVYPDDAGDAETLIRNADIAMFHAKEGGRNSHQFFQRDMNVRAVERQSLERDLRRAVRRQEFVLHYQPKIDLGTGAIAGVEALVRWQHPQQGLILPERFVSLAEECGLIVPIGQWVAREACRQARAWLEAGLPGLPLAINVSAVELRSKDFVASIETALKQARLEPHCLEIELTETALMQNFKYADAVLQAIKDMGIRVALDDFGTGHSSLSYLKRFPVDTLKIDQSFVNDITTDAGDAAIVSAVIAMGKSLRQCVVAEGVETQEQLAFLRSHGCTQAQGFYFSPPVTAGELAAVLRTRGSLRSTVFDVIPA